MQISQNVFFSLFPSKSPKLSSILFLLILHLGSFLTGYLLVFYNKPSFPMAISSLEVEASCLENCQMDSYVLLTSTLPMGAIFGLFLSIPITYYFGRRKTIIFSDFLVLIGFLIMRPFDFMLTTLMARFMFGLFCGINFSIIPVFTSEILKTSSFSQNNVLLWQVFFNFGVFFGFYGFEIQTDLSVIVGVSLFRGLILLFLAKFESPSFLAMRNPPNTLIENQIEAFELPSLYFKSFELLDVFLSPYGMNLFLGVLLFVFYNLTGITLFFFYSSQIEGLNSVVISGLNFFFTVVSFFLCQAVKNKRIFLFLASPINLVIILLMYCGTGRHSAFGVNFIHVLMCFSFQMSFGTVIWPILVNILPDVGVFLSGVGFWGMAFFVSLCVNLRDKQIYYGEDITFLVFLVLSFLIILILFRFLKESKLHSI